MKIMASWQSKGSLSNSSTVASTSVLIERTASGTDQTKKVFDPERISVASGTPTPHGTPEHSVVNRCSFGSSCHFLMHIQLLQLNICYVKAITRNLLMVDVEVEVESLVHPVSIKAHCAKQ
ncbi:hypothetical protein TNIN_131941 [Trichonephila inaurata madagascariensis]|uniref:Uncharacterized protein n=1 Tax=Trichonephila inaurata madagascariensis TaxID=2747483 RepID=A0A8X7CM19_9ARAC|nr:hypothetical protein TNIN_131941 [Trichonephila inaurata madagascariensis]